MIDPQAQALLEKFVLAAKTILYDPQRADALLKMMATEDGVISAVHTVIAAIEQKKHVPPALAPLLGVSIFMLLVDLLKKVTGKTPPAAALKDITAKLMANVAQAGQQPPGGQQPPAQAPMAPQAPAAPQGGIIQGAM